MKIVEYIGMMSAFGGSMALFLFLIRLAVRRWEATYREPFHRQILRPPGYGCLQRREDCLFDCGWWFGVFFAACAGSIGFLAAKNFPEGGWIGFGVVALMSSAFCGWKVHRLLSDARKERLGFLGEITVAEALQKLPQNEWQVFHDIVLTGTQGREFNIDHVAVGPSGIFAIESKAWSKWRVRSRGDNKLVIQNDRVIFPKSGGKIRFKYPLHQAKGQAAALAEWLEQETGEKPWVEAQVVIPGWQVSYRGAQNRQICELDCLTSFLQKPQPNLDTKRRAELAAALERNCRVLRFETPNNPLSKGSHHRQPQIGGQSRPRKDFDPVKR